MLKIKGQQLLDRLKIQQFLDVSKQDLVQQNIQKNLELEGIQAKVDERIAQITPDEEVGEPKIFAEDYSNILNRRVSPDRQKILQEINQVKQRIAEKQKHKKTVRTAFNKIKRSTPDSENLPLLKWDFVDSCRYHRSIKEYAHMSNEILKLVDIMQVDFCGGNQKLRKVTKKKGPPKKKSAAARKKAARLQNPKAFDLGLWRTFLRNTVKRQLEVDFRAIDRVLQNGRLQEAIKRQEQPNLGSPQ